MPVSSGLPALDKILNGIRPGDNVVWQVDAYEDFLPFVRPFYEYTVAGSEKIVYFRFAHARAPLVEGPLVETVTLNPEAGFELFITRIHQKIKEEGKGRNYVFDSMSDLAFG